MEGTDSVWLFQVLHTPHCRSTLSTRQVCLRDGSGVQQSRVYDSRQAGLFPDESLIGKKNIALDTLLDMGAIAVHTAQGAAILRGRHGSLHVHGRVHCRCGCVGGMGLEQTVSVGA